eukprot:6187103-Pleurochrysis_carterae.AAC.2
MKDRLMQRDETGAPHFFHYVPVRVPVPKNLSWVLSALISVRMSKHCSSFLEHANYPLARIGRHDYHVKDLTTRGPHTLARACKLAGQLVLMLRTLADGGGEAD